MNKWRTFNPQSPMQQLTIAIYLASSVSCLTLPLRMNKGRIFNPQSTVQQLTIAVYLARRVGHLIGNLISWGGKTERCKRAQDASTKIVDQKRFKSSTGKRRKHAYQAKRYSNPLMPPGRRTKLLWTMEEEAALKEGIQRFVSNDGGTIPWRAILEYYGCGVFHKTRVPGDLKDKWRNIKIKEDLLQQSCV
ncbi:uncharacterized protein LOC109727229 [Ananas comosus]|uniref:Uncharacterized protein LOC109727229 n=1 Tax=Ananas comosus TaxID=4615 RepID=A0A6P5GYE4_ANACO|nr:uncharacterized protein LOC109727229 [Ananas comosus]